MASSKNFVWFGDEVVRRTRAAAKNGVNKTMADAIVTAKDNHGGWINQTGNAEGSIQIIEQAKQVGDGAQGIWGSIGIDYMSWLELNHGSALRNSAAVNYPRLALNIRGFM